MLTEQGEDSWQQGWMSCTSFCAHHFTCSAGTVCSVCFPRADRRQLGKEGKWFHFWGSWIYWFDGVRWEGVRRLLNKCSNDWRQYFGRHIFQQPQKLKQNWYFFLQCLHSCRVRGNIFWLHPFKKVVWSIWWMEQCTHRGRCRQCSNQTRPQLWWCDCRVCQVGLGLQIVHEDGQWWCMMAY